MACQRDPSLTFELIAPLLQCRTRYHVFLPLDHRPDSSAPSRWTNSGPLLTQTWRDGSDGAKGEKHMAEKSAFLSEAWAAALQEEAQRVLDATPWSSVSSFSYIERFTDAPDPGSPDKRPGYRLEIVNGRAHVRLGVGERESANAVLVMDHDAAQATLTVRSGPEMDALGQLALEQGKLQQLGSFDGMPLDMAALHDAMLTRTLIEIPSGMV